MKTTKRSEAEIRRFLFLKQSRILSSAFINKHSLAHVSNLSEAISRNQEKKKFLLRKTYVSKDAFEKEINMFKTGVIMKCKLDMIQHRLAEVLAKRMTQKIEDNKTRMVIATNLINKRLTLNRQLMYINWISRISEITKNL